VSYANAATAALAAGGAVGGKLKKAVAVNSAPGGDAERVQKMMSARPTLNANRRTAPRQDPSAFSPQGTMVGRGGRTQTAGPAMQRRLAAQQPPLVPDAVQGAIGAEGAAPEVMRQPKMLQGQQLQDAMARRAMPMEPQMGGQAMPPQYQDMIERFKTLSPEEQQAMSITLANPNGGPPVDAPGAAPGQMGIGMPQGVPPQIMQRLQALRAGGGQMGAPGGGGLQRSFADFWQGGMAPRGM
jgi:hypothetical protein